VIIQLLPKWFVTNLDVVALLAIGILVEKNFVGRMTTFSNSIAVNLLFLRLSNLHWVLDWYAGIGFLLGILGAFSYAVWQFSESRYFRGGEFPYRLPSWYYQVCLLYSSIVVALIALAPESLNAWLQQNIH